MTFRLDIEGCWSHRSDLNGRDHEGAGLQNPCNRPGYATVALKLVEPMGIAPTEILLAKQTPLLHSDHGPIVNPVVNYAKLVRVVGIAPTYNTL